MTDSVLFLFLAMFTVAGGYAYFLIKQWLDQRDYRARLDQHQEHQEQFRKAEHKRQLELAEKVDTAIKIMIADETLATVFRDKLNEIYPIPQVRVQAPDAENGEEEAAEQAQTTHPRRSRKSGSANTR